MGWYRNGTISVVSGSKTISGTGTAFIANVRPGFALTGPDGEIYEIESVTSDTACTLVIAYKGMSVSGTAYAIMQTQSMIAELSAQAANLLNSFESSRDAAAASAASAAASAALLGTAASIPQYAAAAGQSASNAAASATAATAAATAGANSAATAVDRASAASTSAATATNQASTATTQATNAAGSATAALASKTAAGTSEANAASSAAAAHASKTAAASSETNAAASAVTAQASKTAAATSEANAAASAVAAQGSKTAAATSEANAAASAAAAQTSKTAAATSETGAAASAAAALVSKTAAGTSESNAAGSAAAALASKTAAGASETNAASSATGALASKTAAATSETNAAASAAAALLSKNAASASEVSAAGSASAALASKTAASSSEVAAAASATAASGSGALARDWATKAGTEVVAGQGYSALKYATDAAASAAAAAVSANQAASGQINADWAENDPLQKSYIRNRPALPTKVSLGIGNVDNTADIAKPVSVAQQAALDLKAPKDSPTFTGPVTLPTLAPGTTSALAANAAFVAGAVADAKAAVKAEILGAAPAALDTLVEFAAALGNDANYAATTASALGNRLRVDTAAQGLTSQQKANALANIGLSNVDNVADANKPVSVPQQTAFNLKQDAAAKDASGGYAGLTGYKVNIKNAAGSVTSYLVSGGTAARTYTFPDKDITVAGLGDIPAASSATPQPGGTASPGVAGTWARADHVHPGGGLLRSPRTGNSMLVASDRGALIDVTANSFSQLLDSVTTLKGGWYCYFTVTGTGQVTLTPYAGQLINGFATMDISSDELWLLTTDGSEWTATLVMDFGKYKFVTAAEPIPAGTLTEYDLSSKLVAWNGVFTTTRGQVVSGAYSFGSGGYNDVCTLLDGRVIVLSFDGTNENALVYDRDGTYISSFAISTAPAYSAFRCSSIVATANGGFVAVWRRASDGFGMIRGYDSGLYPLYPDAVAQASIINSSAIASLGATSEVVVMFSEQGANSVIGRKYSMGGILQGAPVTMLSGTNSELVACSLSSGNFVLVDNGSTGNGAPLEFRIFNAAMGLVAGPTTIQAIGGGARVISIGGKFVVASRDKYNGDSSTTLRAAIYNDNGTVSVANQAIAGPTSMTSVGVAYNGTYLGFTYSGVIGGSGVGLTFDLRQVTLGASLGSSITAPITNSRVVIAAVSRGDFAVYAASTRYKFSSLITNLAGVSTSATAANAAAKIRVRGLASLASKAAANIDFDYSGRTPAGIKGSLYNYAAILTA